MDKKDILIRIALCEQGFKDIKTRLDKIEKSLESLNRLSNMGKGVWRAVFFVGATLSSIWAFLKITNHTGE